MSNEQKVFDEFPQADCNTCRSYMLDQCDGVKVGESRKCTAYEAIRNVDLPLQIEKLRKDVRSLRHSHLIVTLAFMLYLIGQLLT